jgi:YidC/Oxa1 family membrane protein insertase
MFRINVRYVSMGLLIILGYTLATKWDAYQKTTKPEARYQASYTATEDSHKTINPVHSTQDKKAALDRAKLISIETPRFTVWVNPKGGDIIQTQLNDYHTTLHSKEKVSVLGSSQTGIFTAQSGFSGGKDLIFSSKKRNYDLKNNPTKDVTITLNAVNAKGMHYQKRFTFHPDRYTIEVENRIHNQGKTTWKGAFFMQINRLKDAKWVVDKQKIFKVSSDTSTEKPGLFSANRFRTYAGPAYYTPDKPYTKLPYDQIPKNQSALKKVTNGGWVSIQQPYFISAWVPKSLKQFHLFAYEENARYVIGMHSNTFSLGLNQSATYESALYSGPEETSFLKKLAPGLDRTVDYGWLFVLSDPIFKVMQFMYQYIHSWGLSIILITCLIKLLGYKFTESSYKSMINMRKMQPKMQALKDQFGDDKAALNREMSKLMMTNKVNPLGGCLPMLVVLPFFFALYFVLLESVELRHASFLWIPDLSTKDPLYILPVAYGISTWVQQRINPQQGGDSPQAQAMMLMPLFMTVLFVFFPAGLILYMITNNVLSVAQNVWVNKRYKLYEETGFSPMKAIFDFRYKG